MPRQPISPSSVSTVAEARKPPTLAERTKRLETTARCRVGVSSTTIVVAGANDAPRPNPTKNRSTANSTQAPLGITAIAAPRSRR